MSGVARRLDQHNIDKLIENTLQEPAFLSQEIDRATKMMLTRVAQHENGSRPKPTTTRTQWWQRSSWPLKREALFKSIGHAKLLAAEPSSGGWTQVFMVVIWPHHEKSARHRKIIRESLKALCENEAQRAIFDSTYRLNGARSTWKVLQEMVEGPPPTEEEKAERGRARVEAMRNAREQHARRMLARHEQALAREERAVARWGRKVAAYDRARARGAGAAPFAGGRGAKRLPGPGPGQQTGVRPHPQGRPRAGPLAHNVRRKGCRVHAMWITVGNVQSKLTRATDRERIWLTEYLTFEGERRGRQEAKPTCLMNIFSLTFPSGFNSMIAKAAKDEGLDVQFIDNRTAPCERDPNADLAWLRDYQLEAVNTLVRRKRGICWLPTGSGKTEIIVGITRALPCFWVSLVHRSQLADDIASRYEKRSPGLLAGRVLEGRWDVPEDATLVSCTYQSLAAALDKPPMKRPPSAVSDDGEALDTWTRLKGGSREAATALLERAQGLIVDECHTAPAETYLAQLMRTKNAYYRVGLSGTPLARGDARSQYAIAAIGPIVYRIKPQLLIDRGVLAAPTVRMATVEQHTGRVTWQGAYSDLVVRSKARNARVVKYTQRATKPAFVFIEQVEHGHQLVKDLHRSGITSHFVYGNHSIDYRKSLIRRLVAGHFDVIVCSRVFNEGIDVPELRAVVNAGGMKSIIATLQRLGRGMRVDRNAAGEVREGGDKFEVYDILDKGNKWLERHANVRRDAYQNEGYALFVDPPDTTSATPSAKIAR